MNKQTQNVIFSSSSDMWATPQDLFDFLDKEFGSFTLDPCATQFNAKCVKYYTEEDNGLSKSWQGEMVFVNPPYSHIASWCKKAYTESLGNCTVVMLIPARTDTKYFYDYCRHAAPICPIKGRVKFIRPGQTKQYGAPFPSVVCVFESRLAKPLDTDEFKSDFSIPSRFTKSQILRYIKKDKNGPYHFAD